MTATFAYKVRDRTGKVSRGHIEASSPELAARALRQRGLVPLRVARRRSGGLQREITIPGLGRRVRQRDLVLFTREFAAMVNSGLSLIKALSVLVEQTSSPALCAILEAVKTDVEEGTSLSAALERHTRVFGRLYVAMVKAGEAGGVLDETLNRLADMLEAGMNLRSKVKAALAYPAVVGILIGVITTGMIVFVVPIFEGMYADLGEGATLPFPTLVLVHVSEIVRGWWLVLTVLLALVVLGFRQARRTPSGRLAWDTLKLRLPVFGTLFRKTALARFARTFSVLSRTGVPVLQTLDIVGETSGNARIERALAEVKASVREGQSLARPLARHDVFPPMVVQMMTVGEETGSLDDMLGKVADFYDREVEDLVNALTSLIEPLLIVAMGITVGGILIALYLPIFNLASVAT